MVPILCDWCLLRDLIRLETAVCQSDRLLLVRLFSEFLLKFQHLFSLEFVPYSQSYLLWAERNNLKASILVNASFDAYLRPRVSKWSISLCQYLGCFTHRVNLKENDAIDSIFLPANLLRRDPQFIGDILSACMSLKELVIKGEHGVKRPLINFTNVSVSSYTSLEILHLNRIVEGSGFALLLPFCPRLRQIHVDNAHGDLSSMALTALVWCRNLDCFEGQVYDKRNQYMLAFHGRKLFSSIMLSKASDLLLRTVAHYRGRDALKKLSVVRYVLKSCLSVVQILKN